MRFPQRHTDQYFYVGFFLPGVPRIHTVTAEEASFGLTLSIGSCPQLYPEVLAGPFPFPLLNRYFAP